MTYQPPHYVPSQYGPPQTPRVPVDPKVKMASLVKPPAVALMVLCGLMFIQFVVFGGFLLHEALSSPPWVHGDRGDVFFYSAASVSLLLGFFLNIFFLAVARRLTQLRSRTLGIFAAIVVMIPCFSLYLGMLGMGVGVWLLIVLLMPDSKAAFS